MLTIVDWLVTLAVHRSPKLKDQWSWPIVRGRPAQVYTIVTWHSLSSCWGIGPQTIFFWETLFDFSSKWTCRLFLHSDLSSHLWLYRELCTACSATIVSCAGKCSSLRMWRKRTVDVCADRNPDDWSRPTQWRDRPSSAKGIFCRTWVVVEPLLWKIGSSTNQPSNLLVSTGAQDAGPWIEASVLTARKKG